MRKVASKFVNFVEIAITYNHETSKKRERGGVIQISSDKSQGRIFKNDVFLID